MNPVASEFTAAEHGEMDQQRAISIGGWFAKMSSAGIRLDPQPWFVKRTILAGTRVGFRGNALLEPSSELPSCGVAMAAIGTGAMVFTNGIDWWVAGCKTTDSPVIRKENQ